LGHRADRPAIGDRRLCPVHCFLMGENLPGLFPRRKLAVPYLLSSISSGALQTGLIAAGQPVRGETSEVYYSASAGSAFSWEASCHDFRPELCDRVRRAAGSRHGISHILYDIRYLADKSEYYLIIR
jgi:hypothetical protein